MNLNRENMEKSNLFFNWIMRKIPFKTMEIISKKNGQTITEIAKKSNIVYNYLSSYILRKFEAMQLIRTKKDGRRKKIYLVAKGWLVLGELRDIRKLGLGGSYGENN